MKTVDIRAEHIGSGSLVNDLVSSSTIIQHALPIWNIIR